MLLPAARCWAVSIATSLAVAVAMMTALAPPAATRSADGAAGPHSPVDRALAATTVTRRDGVVVRAVDLGDIELGRSPGEYRAPVRGILVTPASTKASHSRLVVVAHLRYPGCAGNRFAYPCPQGRTERRFDRGMTYLGASLARRGYSVLIPDLGPLYIGDNLTDPYDQPAGAAKILEQLIDSAAAASAGQRTRWGRGLRGDIDASRIGLLAHSRSAAVARDLTRSWSGGPHPIAAIMTYGGAYESAYGGEPGTTPMVPDVPYLGIAGDEDRDTPYMAPMWLTHHLGTRRTAPALVAVVPGFGHTLINRTLATAGIDDRICDTGCPDAQKHQAFLSATALDWFDATLRHRRTRIPLRPRSSMPPTLSGVPAHWLAVTNRAHTGVFLAGRRGTLRPFGKGATARTCFPAEPMAPSRPGACRPSRGGVSQNSAEITRVTLTPRSGVILRTPRTPGVTAVALHLAPTGDRSERAPGSPVRVTVRLADGRHVALNVAARDAAVMDRATSSANGTYSIGTVRLDLPRWVARARVVSVKLTGGTASSRFDVRAIDLAQARRRGTR